MLVLIDIRHALKHDDGAAARIVEELAQSGLDKVLVDGERPVEAAMRYSRARLPRMQYAAARREGLPIGSGNVEATCKSLVTVRMKRPGARWKHTTGEEVLQLRVLQPGLVRLLGRVGYRLPTEAEWEFGHDNRWLSKSPTRSSPTCRCSARVAVRIR